MGMNDDSGIFQCFETVYRSFIGTRHPGDGLVLIGKGRFNADLAEESPHRQALAFWCDEVPFVIRFTRILLLVDA